MFLVDQKLKSYNLCYTTLSSKKSLKKFYSNICFVQLFSTRVWKRATFVSNRCNILALLLCQNKNMTLKSKRKEIYMYTILVTQDNELITSVKERIMQRSKLVDSLHFLVDQVYKGIEMKDFTVRVSYFLAGSANEPKSELLSLSPELYKDKLEYKLPFDSDLTREAGDIELSLSFTKSEMDTEGDIKQLC